MKSEYGNKKRVVDRDKLRIDPKITVAPCYDIDWHINHAKIRITEAIGSWMMYHAPPKLRVGKLQILSNMIEEVVVKAMMDAYNHEHTHDGYHFTEDQSPPGSVGSGAPTINKTGLV